MNQVTKNMLISILFLPAVAPVTASKPPKGGSVSPVPPPTQFANEILVQQQSKNVSSSTSSSNVKFSSSSSSKSTKTGGVKVLPSPVSRPVQLQEPAAADASVADDHVDHKLSVDSRNSNEADHFIEQLMKEAETDPKLRELTYGSSAASGGSNPPARPPAPRGQRPPRTTAQDSEEGSRSQSSFLPPLDSGSRTGRSTHRIQEESKMASAALLANAVTKRSQSSDGRLQDNAKKMPRMPNCNGPNAYVASTETLLNDNQEVVAETAVGCKSVRDLVGMMESNIKSESLNPYIRKWGCDLISPEPHKKTVTYRREKKQLVDQLQLNRTMERNKTFTWQQDDHFKRKNQINERADDIVGNGNGNEIEMVLGHQASQHSPSGRDDHDHYLDNHTADLDDLLGRRPSLPETETERTLVVWPPPSPLPPPDQNRYPSPVFSPSPPPPAMQALPCAPRTPSPSPMPVEHTGNGNIDVPMPALSPLPKKSNLKKRSQSESDQTRRFSNSSLHEIDQQIVMIQNEFEAELDTLIDTYRNIQQTSRKTKGSFLFSLKASLI